MSEPVTRNQRIAFLKTAKRMIATATCIGQDHRGRWHVITEVKNLPKTLVPVMRLRSTDQFVRLHGIRYQHLKMGHPPYGLPAQRNRSTYQEGGR